MPAALPLALPPPQRAPVPAPSHAALPPRASHAAPLLRQPTLPTRAAPLLRPPSPSIPSVSASAPFTAHASARCAIGPVESSRQLNRLGALSPRRMPSGASLAPFPASSAARLSSASSVWLSGSSSARPLPARTSTPPLAPSPFTRHSALLLPRPAVAPNGRGGGRRGDGRVVCGRVKRGGDSSAEGPAAGAGAGSSGGAGGADSGGGGGRPTDGGSSTGGGGNNGGGSGGGGRSGRSSGSGGSKPSTPPESLNGSASPALPPTPPPPRQSSPGPSSRSPKAPTASDPPRPPPTPTPTPPLAATRRRRRRERGVGWRRVAWALAAALLWGGGAYAQQRARQYVQARVLPVVEAAVSAQAGRQVALGRVQQLLPWAVSVGPVSIGPAASEFSCAHADAVQVRLHPVASVAQRRVVVGAQVRCATVLVAQQPDWTWLGIPADIDAPASPSSSAPPLSARASLQRQARDAASVAAAEERDRLALRGAQIEYRGEGGAQGAQGLGGRGGEGEAGAKGEGRVVGGREVGGGGRRVEWEWVEEQQRAAERAVSNVLRAAVEALGWQGDGLLRRGGDGSMSTEGTVAAVGGRESEGRKSEARSVDASSAAGGGREAEGSRGAGEGEGSESALRDALALAIRQRMAAHVGGGLVDGQVAGQVGEQGERKGVGVEHEGGLRGSGTREVVEAQGAWGGAARREEVTDRGLAPFTAGAATDRAMDLPLSAGRASPVQQQPAQAQQHKGQASPEDLQQRQQQAEVAVQVERAPHSAAEPLQPLPSPARMSKGGCRRLCVRASGRCASCTQRTDEGGQRCREGEEMAARWGRRARMSEPRVVEHIDAHVTFPALPHSYKRIKVDAHGSLRPPRNFQPAPSHATPSPTTTASSSSSSSSSPQPPGSSGKGKRFSTPFHMMPGDAAAGRKEVEGGAEGGAGEGGGGLLRVAVDVDEDKHEWAVTVTAHNLFAPVMERLLEIPLDWYGGRADGQVQLWMGAGDSFPNFKGRVDIRDLAFQIWESPCAFTRMIVSHIPSLPCHPLSACASTCSAGEQGVSGAVVLEGQRLFLHGVEGRYGHVPLRASGDMDLNQGAGGQYRITAQVQPVEANLLMKTLNAKPLPYPLAGSLQGLLFCRGPLDAPIFEGTAELAADPADVDAAVAAVAELHGVRAVPVGGGEIRGAGTLWVCPQAEADPSAVSVDCWAAGVSLDRLLAFYLPPATAAPPSLLGLASGEAAFRGSLLSPTVEAAWKAPQARGPLEGMRGSVALTRDTAHAATHAHALDLLLSASVSAPPPCPTPPRPPRGAARPWPVLSRELPPLPPRPRVERVEAESRLRAFDALALLPAVPVPVPPPQPSLRHLRLSGRFKLSARVPWGSEVQPGAVDEAGGDGGARQEAEAGLPGLEGSVLIQGLKLNQLLLGANLSGGVAVSPHGFNLHTVGRGDEQLILQLSANGVLPAVPTIPHASSSYMPQAQASEAAFPLFDVGAAAPASSSAGGGVGGVAGGAVRVQRGQMSVEGHVRVGATAALEVRALPLDELELASLRGLVERAAVRLNFAKRRGHGSLAVRRPRFSGMLCDALHAAFRWTGDVVTLERSVLEQANSRYEVQGEYVLPGMREWDRERDRDRTTSSHSASTPTPDAAATAAAAASERGVDTEWGGGGRQGAMRGQLQAMMTSIGRWRLRLDVPHADVSEMLPGLRILSRSHDPAVLLRSKELFLHGIEDVGFSSHSLQHQLEYVREKREREWEPAGTDVGGGLAAEALPGLVDLRGRWHGVLEASGGGNGDTSASFDVHGSDWEAGRYRLQQLQARGRYSNTGGLQVERLLLQKDDGATVHADGTVFGPAPSLHFALLNFPAHLVPTFLQALHAAAPSQSSAAAAASGAPFPPPPPVGVQQAAVRGVVHVEGDLSGSFAQPQCDVQLRLLDGEIAGVALGRAEVAASLTRASRLLFHAVLEPAVDAGQVRIKGNVPLPPLQAGHAGQAAQAGQEVQGAGRDMGGGGGRMVVSGGGRVQEKRRGKAGEKKQKAGVDATQKKEGGGAAREGSRLWHDWDWLDKEGGLWSNGTGSGDGGEAEEKVKKEEEEEEEEEEEGEGEGEGAQKGPELLRSLVELERAFEGEEQAEQMQVEASVQDAGMMLLTALSPSFRWIHGHAAISAQVRGTVARPEVAAEAVFSRVTASSPVLPRPLTGGGGRIRIAAQQLLVDGLEGRVGRRGTLRVEGSLPLGLPAHEGGGAIRLSRGIAYLSQEKDRADTPPSPSVPSSLLPSHRRKTPALSAAPSSAPPGKSAAPDWLPAMSSTASSSAMKLPASAPQQGAPFPLPPLPPSPAPILTDWLSPLLAYTPLSCLTCFTALFARSQLTSLSHVCPLPPLSHALCSSSRPSLHIFLPSRPSESTSSPLSATTATAASAATTAVPPVPLPAPPDLASAPSAPAALVRLRGLQVALGPELRVVYPLILNLATRGDLHLNGFADPRLVRPSGTLFFENGEVNLVATQVPPPSPATQVPPPSPATQVPPPSPATQVPPPSPATQVPPPSPATQVPPPSPATQVPPPSPATQVPPPSPATQVPPPSPATQVPPPSPATQVPPPSPATQVPPPSPATQVPPPSPATQVPPPSPATQVPPPSPATQVPPPSPATQVPPPSPATQVPPPSPATQVPPPSPATQVPPPSPATQVPPPSPATQVPPPSPATQVPPPSPATQVPPPSPATQVPPPSPATQVPPPSPATQVPPPSPATQVPPPSPATQVPPPSPATQVPPPSPATQVPPPSPATQVPPPSPATQVPPPSPATQVPPPSPATQVPPPSPATQVPPPSPATQVPPPSPATQVPPPSPATQVPPPSPATQVPPPSPATQVPPPSPATQVPPPSPATQVPPPSPATQVPPPSPATQVPPPSPATQVPPPSPATQVPPPSPATQVPPPSPATQVPPPSPATQVPPPSPATQVPPPSPATQVPPPSPATQVPPPSPATQVPPPSPATQVPPPSPATQVPPPSPATQVPPPSPATQVPPPSPATQVPPPSPATQVPPPSPATQVPPPSPATQVPPPSPATQVPPPSPATQVPPPSPATQVPPPSPATQVPPPSPATQVPPPSPATQVPPPSPATQVPPPSPATQVPPPSPATQVPPPSPATQVPPPSPATQVPPPSPATQVPPPSPATQVPPPSPATQVPPPSPATQVPPPSPATQVPPPSPATQVPPPSPATQVPPPSPATQVPPPSPATQVPPPSPATQVPPPSPATQVPPPSPATQVPPPSPATQVPPPSPATQVPPPSPATQVPPPLLPPRSHPPLLPPRSHPPLLPPRSHPPLLPPRSHPPLLPPRSHPPLLPPRHSSFSCPFAILPSHASLCSLVTPDLPIPLCRVCHVQLRLNRDHPNCARFEAALGMDPLLDLKLVGADWQMRIQGPANRWQDHVVLTTLPRGGEEDVLSPAEAARLFESQLAESLLEKDGQLALKKLAAATVETLMPKIESRGQFGQARWRLVSAPQIPNLLSLDPTSDPFQSLANLSFGAEVEIQIGNNLQASVVRQLRESEMATQWKLLYQLNSRLRLLFSSLSSVEKRLLFEYSASSQN
ncbi:unnamed protein product [Closterium sp. Yama58-4]|nr:unnamed protein product [Closterium sp. Yama58-4]